MEKAFSEDRAGEPLISIIIPVKNGDFWLDDTLTAIVGQTLFSRTEVIIIDSGSTDRTFEILQKYPVRIIEIPSSSFNHGETRNMGARAAKGKYVVMTVQDAVPVNGRWLEELLAGFEDERVAGVCGQQVVPHERDKNPVQWFRPYSQPRKVRYQYASAEVFDHLPPSEKKAVSSWDDVNAMYRRDVLLELPFRKMVFGEDAQWAIDALRAGYSIVYTDFARVYHYHFEKPPVTYKRMFAACYIRWRLVGFTYQQDRLLSVLINARILLREKISLREKVKWFIYNYRMRSAVNKAITDFNKLIARGEQVVDDEYARICATSPVAVKPEAAI